MLVLIHTLSLVSSAGGIRLVKNYVNWDLKTKGNTGTKTLVIAINVSKLR